MIQIISPHSDSGLFFSNEGGGGGGGRGGGCRDRAGSGAASACTISVVPNTLLPIASTLKKSVTKARRANGRMDSRDAFWYDIF